MASLAMAESPPSSPSLFPLDIEDTYVDESFSESINTGTQLPADTVLQGLNESRTELLGRVQTLKKDLQDWRGKLNTQVKSYREEIGDLRNSLNSEVEQLRIEFQELRNTLKEQMEVTTSKLAELDTSMVDCTQFLDGLNFHCEAEKSMLDSFRADIALQDDPGEPPITPKHPSPTPSLSTVLTE